MRKQRWSVLHPRREEGMALILAIVVTTVVTVLVVAMLSFTSASSRDASLKDAGTTAYALAEAGVSQALAQLASHYYRDNSPNPPSPYQPDGKTPINGSTPFSSSWFATTNSQKSSTDGSPCTYVAGKLKSTCVTWNVTYAAASQGIKYGTITVTATGTVLNPTGAAPVTRRITTKIDVSRPPTLQATPPYWKWIYEGAGPSPGSTCDLTLGQGVTITAPLYAAGNLCLNNTSQISGPNVTLKVFGWVYVSSPQATIGSKNGSPARIASAQIKGGCASKGGPQPTQTSGCTINQSSGTWQIYDNVNGGSAYDHSTNQPTTIPLPSIDWATAQSNQNNSSPAPSCTNGRSLNEATFSLTPSTSYSCTTAVGSIAWNASTRVLTISGNIWFPGNLSIDTGVSLGTYKGIGSFFVGGTITNTNNSGLCVKIVSGECDFANALTTWDATKNLLILQAEGAISGTNFHFQGGIYSLTSINYGGGGGGTAGTQGPLISPHTIIVGQQLNGSFPNFPQIESGSLGTNPPPFNLGAPYGGTY